MLSGGWHAQFCCPQTAATTSSRERREISEQTGFFAGALFPPGMSTDLVNTKEESLGPLSPSKQDQAQCRWISPARCVVEVACLVFGGILEEVGINGLQAWHIHPALGSSSCTQTGYTYSHNQLACLICMCNNQHVCTIMLITSRQLL